jgi:hypothetical protein
MSKSYLPVGDVNLASWYSNFSTKLCNQYGPTVSFTPLELSGIGNDNTALQNMVTHKEHLRQSAIVMTSVVRSLKYSSIQVALGSIPIVPAMLPVPPTVLTGIFNRLAIYVARIKQHANYTVAMGQDLGIIAPLNIFDPAVAKPEVTIKLSGGYPVVKWKRLAADGVFLYVDRRDGNGFVLIDKLVRTEYVDISALPANTFSVTWDYKVRFMIDDNEIGLFSDTVSITVVRV